MNATETIDIVDSVLAGVPGKQRSSFEPGRLEVDAEDVGEIDEARRRIVDFDATTGWIQTASDIVTPEAFEQTTTPVLCAELAHGQRSLHIRQNGAGGWTFYTIDRRESADGSIIRTTDILAKEPFGPRLHYEVEWRPSTSENELQSLRAHTFRLVGEST